ncbi:hypothetical protein BH10BAC2_BH10BAC2_10200 [soil metagenome]
MKSRLALSCIIVACMFTACKKEIENNKTQSLQGSQNLQLTQTNQKPTVILTQTNNSVEHVTILNAKNGNAVSSQALSFDYPYGISENSLFYNNELIIPMGNKLLATDPASHKAIWQTSLTNGDYDGFNFKTAPLCAGGNTIFETLTYTNAGAKKCFAINAETGNVIWSTQLGDNLTSSNDKVSAPAYSNGFVYVPAVNNLYALNATDGSIAWKLSIGQQLFNPCVANNKVYISIVNAAIGHQDSVFVLDAATGVLIWKKEVGKTNEIRTAVTYANSKIYINLTDGLLAMNADDGTQVWKFSVNISHSYGLGPAFVAGGTVYVPEVDHSSLYAIDDATGKRRWKADVGPVASLYNQGPIVSDNIVYLLHPWGYLIAFDASSGTQLWNTYAANIYGLPLVINNNGQTIYDPSSGMQQ